MKKNIHQALRKPFFGRFETPWSWSKDIPQTGWEKVSIPINEQQSLVGYWRKSPKAKATLVLAHPMGKAAKGFWLRYGHADLFFDNNYNVLIYDANGFGESQGYSFNYPNDVYYAGLYAKNKAPELDVGLVGASFGAAWGLCSLAKDNHPYRVAILEAAFPTLPEFWKHYPLANLCLKISMMFAPKFNKELNPLAKAVQVKSNPPILLLYGDQDIYTPPEHGYRLKEALSQATAVSLEIFEGAGHTYIYKNYPQQYKDKVLPFLDAHLA